MKPQKLRPSCYDYKGTWVKMGAFGLEEGRWGGNKVLFSEEW